MSSESSSVPRDAMAPFGPGADSFSATRPTDFIIRSCDDVDFHVHKDILKFASDVFQDMFAVATPNMADEEPITRDGKPVLKLEESHSVIHKLLCHAYPPRFPRQSKLDADDIDPDFVGIYRAAHKCQFLVVEETLKTAMNEFSALRAFPDPYRVFAIGKLLGHTKLAKAAIFASAGCDIKPEALDFPELRLLAWADGQHMLRLNVRYKEGVRAALEPAQTPHSYVVHSPHSSYHSANVTFAWFQQQQQHSGSCRLSDSPDGACAQWFTSHIANVRDGGLKLPHSPTGTRTSITLLEPRLRRIVATCGLCSSVADKHLGKFADYVVKILDDLVVSLDAEIESVLL